MVSDFLHGISVTTVVNNTDYYICESDGTASATKEVVSPSCVPANVSAAGCLRQFFYTAAGYGYGERGRSSQQSVG